jgi:hypothetical protein
VRTTTLQVYLLPQIGERDPVAIGRAGQATPSRVEIRNLSATTVNVGLAQQDIQGPNGITSTIWQIPPGEKDLFILADGQVLFANASAPNARICVQVSEAYPFEAPR